MTLWNRLKRYVLKGMYLSSACNCDATGSASLQCDSFGACTCHTGYTDPSCTTWKWNMHR